MNVTAPRNEPERAEMPAPRRQTPTAAPGVAAEPPRRWFFSYDGWRTEEADEGYVLA